MRPRNLPLERHLTEIAGRASGASAAAAPHLSAYSNARALPGGVRYDLDPTREIAEELSDARNYAVWGIERIYQRVLDGDPDACDEYERLMRTLGRIIAAWQDLHTTSS